MVVLESNFLVPNAYFVVAALVYLAVLVVWPFIEAAVRGRWIWAIAIALLSPLGGIAWFAKQRREAIFAAAFIAGRARAGACGPAPR